MKVGEIYARSISTPDRIPEDFHYRSLQFTLQVLHEIIDGVLHFFVDYNFQIIKETTLDPLMQTMEQEGFIRG